MAMYREGRYEAAIPGLIAASGADRSHAGSRFFLGICLSMTGKPERASEVFREAAAIGDTPYLESTNFFLAKSHLRLNQPDSARRELEKVIGMRGDLEADARKLLAELQKIVPAGGG
jgi:tetratricopeptide (TPR) repeat protein